MILSVINNNDVEQY